MSSSGLPGFGHEATSTDHRVLDLTPSAIIVSVALFVLAVLFALRVWHFVAWKGMWNPQELWPEVVVHCAAYIFAIVQSVVFFPPQQSQTLRVSQIFFMAALGASQVTQILLYRRVFGWATKRLWKNFNSLLVAVCIFAVIPVIVAGLDSVQAAIGLPLMCFTVISESIVASIGPACFLVWMLDKPPASFDDSYDDPSGRHATIRLDIVRLIAGILVCFWVIQFIENDGFPSIATLILQQLAIITSFASIPPFIPLLVYRLVNEKLRGRKKRNPPPGRSQKRNPRHDSPLRNTEYHDNEMQDLSFEDFLASGSH